MTALTEFVRVRPDAECSVLAEKFTSGYPFPHLCIDDFFADGFIEALARDFPSRDDPDYVRFCMEDGDQVGSNYANNDPASFPGAFARLDRLSADPAFRDYLSRITGIRDLEFDPQYHGGGIRESRSKVFLPVHLDFNYHPQTLSHRRLNFLLYLNDRWEPAWGGNLQLHLDPNVYRDRSLVDSFSPVMNRVLIFETSEKSWHGFDRLDPPEGMSRRAWSIYYYTQVREDGDAIRRRNTEYVEPGLPAKFREGHTLSREDVQLLREMMMRRDDRIAMLYDMRRTFDDRYSHLWNEYEYYLAKSRELEQSLRLETTD